MTKNPMRSFRVKLAGMIKIICAWTGRLLMSVSDVAWILIAESPRDYARTVRRLPKAPSGEMMVMANGPSLKGVLDQIKMEPASWTDNDFFFVNYLGQDEVFNIVRPRHYCLSDPQFFLDGYPRSERGRQLLRYLHDNTAWDMNLYVPFVFRKTVRWMESNPHIRIVPMHFNGNMGLDSVHRWLDRHGLGNGEYGTVVQNAIYVSVRLQYKTIRLFGVDHNYFDNLCLDEHNVLCSRMGHFYDTGKPELKPIRVAKDTMSVGDFLGYYATLFDGYYKLRRYADECGCRIINHTRGSLIDAFDKAE